MESPPVCSIFKPAVAKGFTRCCCAWCHQGTFRWAEAVDRGVTTSIRRGGSHRGPPAATRRPPTSHRPLSQLSRARCERPARAAPPSRGAAPAGHAAPATGAAGDPRLRGGAPLCPRRARANPPKQLRKRRPRKQHAPGFETTQPARFCPGAAEEAAERSSSPLDVAATPSGNPAGSWSASGTVTAEHQSNLGRPKQSGTVRPRQSRHLHSCVAAVITAPSATAPKQQRWKRTSDTWEDL